MNRLVAPATTTSLADEEQYAATGQGQVNR
jgi:hypothetical protein